MRLKNIAVCVVSAAVCAACGGGSGGGDAPAPVVSLKLSASNYVGASQEALSSAFALQSSTGLVTGVQTSHANLALPFAQAQLGKLADWVHAAPTVVGGVTTSVNEACTGGGSLAITVNDSNNNSSFDAGDKITIVASNCKFDGSFITGTLGMTLNALTGDLNTVVYSANIGLQFTGLKTVTGGETTQVDGAATLVAQSTASNNSTSTESVPTTLTVVSVVGSTTTTQTLSQYSLTETLRPAAVGYTDTVSAAGTLSTSGLAGQALTVSTPVPLVRASADTYPASGQVLVNGGSNSKLRITVQNSSQVLIELDSDGDGAYETSTTRAWSSLL